MSALFTPIKLRGLGLANRIMVAPMCQYSSVDGEANDWHFTHINSLALSGAAMFCIEATAVEPIGRITPGCPGLWNGEKKAGWKRIVDFIHANSPAQVAMQLGHAGPKGATRRSSRVPASHAASSGRVPKPVKRPSSRSRRARARRAPLFSISSTVPRSTPPSA